MLEHDRDCIFSKAIFSHEAYRELNFIHFQFGMPSISFAKMEQNKQQLMGTEWKQA